jgi:hypothetical protein
MLSPTRKQSGNHLCDSSKVGCTKITNLPRSVAWRQVAPATWHARWSRACGAAAALGHPLRTRRVYPRSEDFPSVRFETF